MVRMFLSVLKGVPTTLLECMFDQTERTVRDDVEFCQLALIRHLDKKWIKWFDVNSREYQDNKCCGRVEVFENVIAIGDGTLVSI